jgi:hypothetical protein
MKVDLILSNAKVYDVNRIEIRKDEPFQLEADTSGKYFSDNDPVLELTVKSDKVVHGIASGFGTSIIWIVDDNKQVIKELTISVVAYIEPQATALNLSAQ